MALQEEVTKHREDTASVDILDGAAILAVSPIVIPALLLGLRPVAKTFIKGSLFLTNMVKQFATPPSEARSNAVAEGRTATRTVSAPQLAGTRAEPPPQADTAGLERITGIGSKWAMLLKAAGVSRVYDLAQWDPADLHAELTKINDKDNIVGLVPSLEQVTEWMAQATDKSGLEHIPGIGSKRAMLLKATGVSTVHDLAQWDPADLHAELTKINDKDDVIGLVPSLEQVIEWIAQAKREVV
jgi:predicted flap endonuclease-1-like 5' DNA nuclease